MTLILPLLPARVRPYAKAAVVTVGTLAGLASFYLADEPKVAVVVHVLTALGVYVQPNADTP
ncbi:hypothetical protein [Streptomyces sp. NPDC047097]|uniref:DUF7439 family protein n=1 Tax=Streptomyces sp. NPDC047097 TaxID=3155260 RepID=UPI0033DEE280